MNAYTIEDASNNYSKPTPSISNKLHLTTDKYTFLCSINREESRQTSQLILDLVWGSGRESIYTFRGFRRGREYTVK